MEGEYTHCLDHFADTQTLTCESGHGRPIEWHYRSLNCKCSSGWYEGGLRVVKIECGTIYLKIELCDNLKSCPSHRPSPGPLLALGPRHSPCPSLCPSPGPRPALAPRSRPCSSPRPSPGPGLLLALDPRPSFCPSPRTSPGPGTRCGFVFVTPDPITSRAWRSPARH